MTESNQAARRGATLIATAIGVLVVIAALVGVTVWRARGEGSTTELRPTDSATPGPTAPAAEQEAAEKAISAYNAFREAYIAAAGTGDHGSAELAKYVADPLLLETRFALQTQDAQGIVLQGRPTWSARVTMVNLSTRPYSATIEDCLDTTNWKPVYKATGKSAAASDQALRYIVTSTAQLYDDGRWLVNQSQADRSRPC